MRITETGYIVSRGTHPIGVHGHSQECEFHLFTHGIGRFVNATGRLPFRSPALVYSSENQEHGCESDQPSQDTSFYFVRFIPDQETREVLQAASRALPWERAREAAGRYLHFFEDIRTKTAHNGPSARKSAEHLLMALLYEIASEADPLPLRPRHPSVERLIRTMQQSVMGSISIDEWARKEGIAKSHLCRRFRACTGLTALQYYHRLKMESARHLLDNGDEPIYVIAQRLCFWDEFHFSKVFKRYMGVAPSAYRRRAGGAGESTGTAVLPKAPR